MTKQEMIKAVNEKVEGATNKLVDEVLKAYADVVFETLKKALSIDTASLEVILGFCEFFRFFLVFSILTPFYPLVSLV